MNPPAIERYLFWIWSGILDFINLDFRVLHYSDANRALYIGATLLLLVVTRVLWSFFFKDKFSQLSSGHKINRKSYWNIVTRLVRAVPKAIIVMAVAFLVTALAEPFFSQTQKGTKIVESRIRIDIRDISSSMEEPFPGTDKSKAEIAANAHAEFVKMRAGKNDRVSLWLFATYPYMVEDFIVDDEIYYYQIVDANWITGYKKTNLDSLFHRRPDYYIPRERFVVIDGENGTTDLALMLKSAIKQFDSDKVNVGKSRRSMLIVTDGEPDSVSDAERELKELQKRNIVPYILFIRSLDRNNSDMGTVSLRPIPPIVKNIGRYGGKYFDIRDQNSFKEAYREVDSLEKVKSEVKVFTVKVPVFQKFIFAGVVLLVISLFIGIIFELFGIYP